MKKNIFILLLAVLLLCLCSCKNENDSSPTIQNRSKEYTKGQLSLQVDTSTDKMVIVASDGTVVSQKKYDSMIMLDDQFVRVSIDDKQGIIDIWENVVVPIQYDECVPSSDMQYVRVYNKEKNTYGIFRFDGKEILPCKYRSIYLEKNDMFVCLSYSGYYIADANGNIKNTNPFSSYEASQLSPCYIFYEEFFYDERGSKLQAGVLDEYGNICVQAIYDQIQFVNSNYFCYKKNKLWGIGKTNGEIVIEAMYDSFDFSTASPYIIVSKSGYKGLLDKDFNTLLQLEYSDIGAVLNDVAVVKILDSYGVVDLTGKTVIPSKFQQITLYPECIVTYRHTTTAIDLEYYYAAYNYSGVQIVPEIYKRMTVKEHMILGKTERLDVYGQFSKSDCLYDMNGKELITLEYLNSVMSFKHSNGIITIDWGSDNLIHVCLLYTSGLTRIPLHTVLDMNIKPILNEYSYYQDPIFSEWGYAYYVIPTMVESRVRQGEYDVDTTRSTIVHIQKGVLRTWDNEIYYSDGLSILGLQYASHLGLKTCNGYYAVTESYYDVVGLYDTRSNSNVAESFYGSVEFISGTNCIIVSDYETGLFGLYDGYDFVMQCNYEKITYNGSQFELQRGLGIHYYTPSNNVPSPL